MKNKKLSLGFASAFVAILSLTACSGVSANDKAIVTYTDSTGHETTILTNSIYDKYRNTSDGISKFYTAILETVIRQEFDSRGSDEAVYKKTNKQIQDEAKNNVESSKQEAEDNAKTNSTSYSEEWEKILESNGCEDEAELLQSYIYKIEKTEIEDKYFNEHKSTSTATAPSLTEEYIGIKDNGDAVATHGGVNSAFPYHIRHVLVSISDGKTAYADDKITKDEAKNLGTVMSYLIDSKYTFAQTATKLSGDTGSAEKGGDLGIMTTTTSFVNEFKLGIYAYDAVFNSNNKDRNAAIEKGLGLSANIKTIDTTTIQPKTDTVKNSLLAVGLDEVPYDAFQYIGDEYETEKVDGQKINDGNENYYPRNIIWNNYLNKHNPFLITNEIFEKSGNERTTNIVVDTSITDLAKWSDVVDPATNKRYLTDGEGHIIIGVRSEHGIHLMICQKSIYDYCVPTSSTTSLEEYYTNLVPGDEDFPHYTDPSGKRIEKNTYVNFISSEDKSQYNTRATEIKDAIKGFDSTYSYRLYESLVTAKKVTFNGENGRNLGTQIDRYINATRINNKTSSDHTLNDAWRSYIELLNVQEQERDYVVGKTTGTGEDIKRVVNIRCAVGFKSHTGADWEEGGMCYYEA